MYKRLKDFIRNCYIAILSRYYPRKLASFLFYSHFKRPLNWENPQDINEKINWLKFYGDTSLWPKLADKFRVRDFVKERGLGDLLIPLYGHWNRVEDIDWGALPDRFVMKTNCGSGDVLICKDKALLDIAHWKSFFKQMLCQKFGRLFAEPHYNLIPPCVIAEKMLDPTRQAIPSASLIDYKVWSFDGEPAYIVVYHDRTEESIQVAVFDLEWHPHPEFVVPDGHYLLSHEIVPPPVNLERMIKAASILSKGQPEVRVDFYEVDNQLYFGELTLTASAGYNISYSPEFRLKLGQLCHLQLPTSSVVHEN